MAEQVDPFLARHIGPPFFLLLASPDPRRAGEVRNLGDDPSAAARRPSPETELREFRRNTGDPWSVKHRQERGSRVAALAPPDPWPGCRAPRGPGGAKNVTIALLLSGDGEARNERNPRPAAITFG
jgi:hypothetical protein